MQPLIVKHLNNGAGNALPAHLSPYMDSLPRQAISQLSWPLYPGQPEVYFSIAYTGTFLLLKYFVQEPYMRAVHRQLNAPVYEDSCVECFMAFDNKGYYNLEFNALGTALVAYGPGRENRTFLDENAIRQIGVYASGATKTENKYKWSLMLVIPATLFTFHSISSWHGIRCRANFYKCGDLLPEPHYVSWSKIEAPEPDFHVPDYFGALQFQ